MARAKSPRDLRFDRVSELARQKRLKSAAEVSLMRVIADRCGTLEDGSPFRFNIHRDDLMAITGISTTKTCTGALKRMQSVGFIHNWNPPGSKKGYQFTLGPRFQPEGQLDLITPSGVEKHPASPKPSGVENDPASTPSGVEKHPDPGSKSTPDIVTRRTELLPEGIARNNDVVTTNGTPVRDIHAVIDLYHGICTDLDQFHDRLPNATTTRVNLMRRANDQPSHVDWADLFRRVHASDFLNGRTDRSNFKADLPWIAQAANFRKILDGRYDNATPDDRDHSNRQRLVRQIQDVASIPDPRKPQP